MAPALDSDAKLLDHHLMLSPQLENQGQEDDGFLIAQMAWSIVVPMALKTTIELGVFDIIAKADNVFSQSWNELKGAILEGGIPFNRAHGMHVFEYAKIDDRFNNVFNKAMHNSSTILMKKILDVYNGFDNINKLVDVGGGVGANIKLITSKHPRIHGINFDLPHVIDCVSPYDGVEYVGGDMFESVPDGDAIFMKRILHDWGNEECLKILRNCFKAIPNDGKVIVVETSLPIVPEATSLAKNAFKYDIVMMTQMPGGIERTKQDFMDLANGSGFSGIRFVCCVSSFWVMEFYK
ncbi:hypothetical protein PIB30_045729 [Stylosanthes scabra]|uniref:O-methyltransferase C-terminal domain-containing protein n=1 Tax=Stylosanthes scabra TaxID=79078 RepID=A0ABU6YEW7_9FABA|nr:hypothetical protein [Stylosanthes scabra]